MIGRITFGVVTLSLASAAFAADDIVVGDVVSDEPTLCCLGFSVPITAGDDNYNASATIEYRPAGSATWSDGLPLLRVRPEYTSGETTPGRYGLPVPGEQFAGSVFGLDAGSSYDIRITVTDPDGGDRVQQVTTSTRAAPLANPATPRSVAVTNATELDNAIAAAQPGDVIELAAGNYSGAITIDADGTVDNPIIVRGASADSVTIDASGATYGVTIRGEHVYVENLTVDGSTWGARATGTRGAVIRYSRFTDVSRGIFAKGGSNYGFYICDNVLEGRHTWPDISRDTWNSEGITVSGQGHTVCHNTLSGFGDALGLAHDTNIENNAIDFWGNDVRFTGDDGMELDFAHRNVRAFGNRITNANMGASLQPAWGGPVYIFRNQFLNIASSPYKLNNDPNGFFIFHNTSATTDRPGSNYADHAWPQLGYTQSDGDPAYAANFELKNNILIGQGTPAKVTTELFLAVIDHNGWRPDGEFRFWDVWVNFADLQSNAPYENNGRLLDDETFATPLTLPADYTTLWADVDVTLGDSSLARDAGEILPNINDDHAGSAPDLGAIEYGSPMPHYGVRESLDTMPPAAPVNIRVE